MKLLLGVVILPLIVTAVLGPVAGGVVFLGALVVVAVREAAGGSD